MNSLRTQPTRRAVTIVFRSCSKPQNSRRALSSRALAVFTKRTPRPFVPTTSSFHESMRISPLFRTYATPTSSPSSLSANELLEKLQDQYATARDEFEIATEETEKKTVYAADDRAAARKELDLLKEIFEEALRGEHGVEVKSRVGSRVRELESALIALEESALAD